MMFDLQQQETKWPHYWNPEEFVTNLENSFGLISALIPGPASSIMIVVWLSFLP
jgi:hypothetical protein